MTFDALVALRDAGGLVDLLIALIADQHRMRAEDPMVARAATA